jgi:hypothetical protein
MTPFLTLLSIPEWWREFDLTVQIFYGIGLVAGLVIAVLAVMSVVGLDHDHLDSVGDAGGDAGDGTSLLSVKPILGFLLGFGWAGGAARSNDYSLPVSCGIALVAGAIAMACIFLLIRSTSRMRSDGTLKMANAVGQIGTVYINLPGGSATGGQITVNVGDRMIVLQAIHSGPATLQSGTKVKVLEFIGSDTVRVATLG